MITTDTININEEALRVDPGISITQEGQNTVPVGGQVARNRAETYHYTMGPDSPGVAELENTIGTGGEEALRNAYGIQTAVRDRHGMQAMLAKLARGNVTIEAAKQAALAYRSPLLTDFSTIMEEKFAKRYMEDILTNRTDPQSVGYQAVNLDPNATGRAITGGEYLLTMNQIAVKNFHDIEAQYNSDNVFSRTLNTIGTMLPGVSAVNISETKSVMDIVTPGSYLAQEADKFWSFSDPAAAKKWLETRTKQIAEFNPADAVSFAKHIVSMSRADVVAGNIIGIGDVATPLQAVGAGAKVLGVTTAAGAAFRRLVRDSVRGATAEDALRLDNVYAAVGDMDKAAGIRSAKKIFQSADPLAITVDLQTKLPGWYNNSTGIFANQAISIPNDRAMKMEKTIQYIRSELAAGILEGLRIPRVPRETLEVMAAETKLRINRHFNRVNDYVVDYRPVYTKATNTWHEEALLGKADGTLFPTRKAAEYYGYNEIGLPHGTFAVSDLPTESAKYLSREAAVAQHYGQFTTSKGSTYQVHPDGTTTRNKAARPEHPGDEGPQLRSRKTVYVTKDDANALAPVKGASWRYQDTEGALSLITRTHTRPWAKSSLTSSDIPYKTEPAVGLIPVELWNPQKLRGEQTFGKVHFGNEITTIGTKETKYALEQQGNFWYISVHKPMDETHQLARQALTIPTNNQNPNSAGGAFVDMLVSPVKGLMKAAAAGIKNVRTAEELVADFQRGNRHLATHIAPELQRVMAEQAAYIGGLSRGSRMDLQRILEINRDYEERGLRGIAWKTQADLEFEWVKAHGNVPTEAESLAYWAYHSIQDSDYIMRTLGVNRDFTRQGVETITITLGEGELGRTKSFPGRIAELDEFLHSASNPGLMIVEQGKPIRHVWRKSLEKDPELKDSLVSLEKEQGYNIVKVAIPTDRPFTDTGIGNTVNFVAVKGIETQPLRFDLVPYRPGVHVIYLHEHFVKVPMLAEGEKGEMRYYGDKTISLAYTEAEAKRQAQALSELQNMLRNQATDDQLNAFIAGKLPEDAVYWRNQFTKPDGIGLTEPIMNVHSGKQVLEQHPHLKDRYELQADGTRKEIVNERNSEHNMARAVDMDFIADRDTTMYYMNKVGGTPEQPIYRREVAKTVDPYVALNRGVNNAIRNYLLNDHKISAIEQWASQYAKLVTNVDATKNPFEAFYHGKLNDNVMDRDAYHSALVTKNRIENFIGLRTQFGDDLTRLEIAVMNGMGEQKAGYYKEHEKHFAFINDPVNFTRKFMFHNIFGLGNIKQFAIQAQGYSTVWGIMTGAHGAIEGSRMTARSIAGYTSTVAAYLNPKHLDHLDSLMVKAGWAPGQFKESFNTLRATGFDIVGSEHALRESTFDPKLWSNGVDHILEWGAAPFREGERLTRVVAWHAAFQEFRKANPVVALDQFNIADILRRADDLSANMTRASNSAIQEGWFRVPSQFYTYTQRMMELYWGKRLTLKEKTGMFAMHSLLYGVPVAASTATLLPLYEMTRANNILSGNENVHKDYQKIITQGFMSYMLYHLTGQEYNTEQRYGPGAQDRLYKIFTGDRDLLPTLLGATGDYIDSMWKSFDPMMRSIYVAATNQDRNFLPTTNHLINMAKNVSSVNDYMNAWAVYNTGVYITKNANMLTKGLNGKDALAILAGLTPRHVSDARIVLSGIKDQKALQERVSRLAEIEIKLAYISRREGNETNWRNHMNNAYSYMEVFGRMSNDDIAKVIDRVRRDHDTLYEQAREQYLNKGFADQIRQRRLNNPRGF